MVKLEQKVYTNANNECFAFVECTLVDGKYTYTCRFDEQTKKRYNNMCRAKGFIVGKVNSAADVPEKVVEI